MKMIVEVSLYGCWRTILETAQKRMDAFDELKAKSLSTANIIREIREGNELSLMRQYGLTGRTVVTLMGLSLADLRSDRYDYYEKVVEHLNEIVKSKQLPV